MSTAQPKPAWIVFLDSGDPALRVPFEDKSHPGLFGWFYVLSLTSCGFHAFRHGDAIMLTLPPEIEECAQ